MSYDVSVVDTDGNEVVLSSTNVEQGGTYAIGGTRDAWLNITYNYSEFFRKQLGSDGIYRLDGMKPEEALPLVENAVDNMVGERDADYWAKTEGNAKAALTSLGKILKAAIEDGYDGSRGCKIHVG